MSRTPIEQPPPLRRAPAQPPAGPLVPGKLHARLQVRAPYPEEAPRNAGIPAIRGRLACFRGGWGWGEGAAASSNPGEVGLHVPPLGSARTPTRARPADYDRSACRPRPLAGITALCNLRVERRHVLLPRCFAATQRRARGKPPPLGRTELRTELRTPPPSLNSKGTVSRFSQRVSSTALSVPYAKVGSASEQSIGGGGRPVMSLADEVAAVHAGRPDPAALVGEFRRAHVLIPTVNDTLMSADMDGIRWLYAFTDEDALSRFALSRGSEPGTEWRYVTASGARVLDVLIPACEGPTGVALDAGSEQGALFPPVAGIVPDSAAVDIPTGGIPDVAHKGEE
ncbi:SseB family protein [Streptomyces sp. bgisy130]|uniref:SseB family protein n=1 Tax=Streptomyces sp. bgisy130 TaxID=3413788 RepID=UPI003F4A3891